MKTLELLGKSLSPHCSPKTLVGHTIDVVEAGESLFGTADAPTRLGLRWLSFFRLTAADWPRFHSALLAASLFHDWGKANGHMQAIFHGSPDGQLFRHEHLSVLMLGSEGVSTWAKQRADIDWDVVLAAVGSHHLKFSHEEFAPEILDQATRVLVDHDDFRDGLIGETASRLNLAGRPTFPSQPFWGFTGDATTFDPSALRLKLQKRLIKIKESPLLSAVRAALIAADAAGSGLSRMGQSIGDWIGGHFDEAALCDEALIGGIVGKRVADLNERFAKRGKPPFAWSQFQRDTEVLPDRALLLAPCGSGKTLAAWKWILGRVRARPVKRVLFLYPTRATATEGFKDYVSWAPEADASLLHGTAGYDLDGMFPTGEKRDYNGNDPRLFALQHWPKRVFSATVDQFFAFMAYAYGPTCLLPLLADSVVVVDEVHSFDKAMFSALLGFLKAFDVPVLCMTATLQAGRKQQLAALVDEVYGYDRQPADLAKVAEEPRYRVAQVACTAVEALIRDAVAQGKRVLWVVNQVSRAQTAAAGLADLGVEVICYHSRFKLSDRRTRHRDTVAAIRAGEPAAVVVSTQVCEMSLDIDADVLVTEECPIPSLIQRMGRCRRGQDELIAKGPGEVYVYQPADKEKVYSEADRAGLGPFLTFLQLKPAVSQTDLEAGLDQFGTKGTDAPKINSFLASGAYAHAGMDSYRDIEAFNVQAVLDTEVTQYLAARDDKKPGFVVPVPRKLKPTADGRLPRWLHVADARHYDAATGFHDQSLS